MNTLTNCAEKKAKQFLNLLQGYTKGIRFTAILILLLTGVGNAWARNIFFSYGTTYSWWKNDNAVFYAYFFNNGEDWRKMIDSNGDGIYECEIPDNKYTSVIIVRKNPSNDYAGWDGKWNQTVDLTISDVQNPLFTITGVENGNNNGSWTDTYTTATYDKFYIRGDFSNCSWDNSKHWQFDNSWKVTKNIAKGNYEFKVYASYNQWWGNNGTMTRGNSSAWTMDTKESNNCKITIDRTGDYTFTYDKNNRELTVTYPEACFLVGSFNSWNEDNTYSLINGSTTVHLTAGQHTFKIYNYSNSSSNIYYGNNGTMYRDNCTNWQMSSSEGDCTISADVAGDYIFTFDRTTMQLSVTYPQLGGCYLKGSFNNWSEDHSLESGSVSVELTKGNHTFKIHEGGIWYGNSGTMTRGNSSNWTMSNNDNTDCTITADITGNYTFTYNKDTKNLSVTYPAAYKVTYGVGTNKGTTSVTTVPSINSGNLVLASTEITFSKGATKAGYTWKNWNSKADGTGKNLGTGDTYVSASRAGDISVYACYDLITYNITYNTNGGTNPNNAQTSYNVTTATFNLPTPTKTGYTFEGWYSESDFSGTKQTQITKGSTDNKTYYAKWTANKYTVKFNGNGNTSGSMSNQSFTYDEAAKALTANAFSRTGYTFAGWNTNQDGSGTKYEDKASVQNLTTTNNATFNLYAQWTPNTYTVHLDRQQGEGGTSEITATYDAAMPRIVIPTRTGYTFGGYYTAVNGGGTQYYKADGSSARTWNKTAATTLYAKWTETVHTVTVKSNDNTYGTVSPTSVSVGMHTASDKITATPEFGHVFKYWSATDGITISDEYSASTTIKATQPGTLTAVFAKGEPVSIYMRANHIWKRANARYAVYYWHGSDNGWADMEEVGSCDETYYKAQIPFGYTDYLIARLSPYNEENSFTPDNPTDKGPFWNKTADIVMPQDGKTFYNMRKIYFRPNNLWITNNNARFAAYFLMKDDQTKTKNKWMSLLPTETDGLYWCDFPTEHDFDQVIFCSMEPANQTNDWGNRWNETAPQELINVNCFTMTEGEWGKGTGNDADKPGASGSWSMIGEKPGYDLTLYASSFGEYGYIHNNTRYYSPKSGSEIHKIPFENPTIKIFSNPYSDQYRGDVMYNVIGANDRSELQPGETLTFHCNTVLDDNYKTKGTHVVYLAVPNNSGSWISNAATKHHVYAFHSRTEEGKGESVFMGSEVGRAKIKLGNGEVEHIYFRCEVPAWCNTIRFEKRADFKADDNDLRTIDLKYEIPLNSINCYRLDRKEDANNNHSYAGIWEEAPGFNGDYRVICQRKEGDKVVEYASDVIRKGTISQTISLHIYTEGADANYPKLILQKHDGTEWKAVSGQDKLVKDISKIMTDTKEGGCGVWNFVVTQDANGSNPQVNFTSPERYTGNYYIRTNNAEGQWRNYTLSTNQMTFSSYAKHNSGYSHYFCKWVDINMINEKESSKLPGYNNNVKFIIANDHGAAISAEMAEDDHTASGGILPQDANVRWTWNEKDNSVSRAYILGAYDPDKGGARNENIVVNYTTGAQKDTLEDKENWIYEIDLTDVQVNSQLQQLQATYPSENKTVYIDETTTKTVTPSTQIFASNLIMLDAEDGNNNTYTVRIIYDFKIDKTLVMLLPDKNYESHIGIDVFIDRTDQGEATQVKATITRETPAEDPGYTVYGTMTFTQEHIMSLVKTEWERLYYWVSFPFDVRISDVFGFGEYGKHWIMEYYDGAERAKEGCWIDSPTYWRYITDTTYVAGKELEDTNGNPQNGVLVANRGYVLALARNIANMGLFKNNNEYVRLYFPSMNKITSIDENMQDVSVTLPAHRCDIQRDNRYIYDSHWNIIGVPSYANKNQTIAQDGFFYYYTYNTKDNTYTATSIGDIEFKSMHAYMVQHAGTIDWKAWHSASSTPELLAQRRTSQTPDHYSLRLELQRDGQYADQTFVLLHADDATTEFDINKDLTKILNAGANIYTLTGEQQIQVAGNVLPITKTTIPVGVQVAQSGTYTFALPDGTDGISVTLVDNLTSAHTNMLLDKYTVTLDAGTIENRFYLVVDPDRAATSVENVFGDEAKGNEAKGVEKFLIDGQLIIRTTDGIFDAKGQRL